MQDLAKTLEGSLTELSKRDWLTALADLSENNGHFQPLGRKHFSSYIAGGETLLVTFESYDGIQRISPNAHPLGWEVAKVLGWSSLSLISDGQSWFRDREIYAYFDDLVDDGFFEEFDNVIFYGAGPCGYAAAAYSIAAPGARVLALQPQATLDPRVAEWDDRFIRQRRLDFTSRYGYAPDMIDAAAEAFVIYDPEETEDAMHAALFTRPNVHKLRLRHAGGSLQYSLRNMKILSRLIALASTGRLTPEIFAKLARARREDRQYLRNLLRHTDDKGRTKLSYVICKNVIARMEGVPAFERRLKGLETRLAELTEADS
ncbi:phosphoadenosine phosphosulfate reductase [Lentibacter sp. XHP0401]|uniref:phosphoadenosine phosphosulfate reductase n=1 Tax=Lentibacter sp. XHP0401 TaxID=2984334 RepID=UPI0021E7B77C|nr:phosphoadenosine phosphosulfate reductase [Lentibacter sp. XHP0401]MCV2891872.1 phosphoadenosine phosphosulfate reductase [Lentibacter sp. XHP0401]